jgi:hypothetical protein
MSCEIARATWARVCLCLCPSPANDDPCDSRPQAQAYAENSPHGAITTTPCACSSLADQEAVLSRKHANPLVICDLPTYPARFPMARLSPTPMCASQPSACESRPLELSVIPRSHSDKLCEHVTSTRAGQPSSNPAHHACTCTPTTRRSETFPIAGRTKEFSANAARGPPHRCASTPDTALTHGRCNCAAQQPTRTPSLRALSPGDSA